jgi:hypothetical protein
VLDSGRLSTSHEYAIRAWLKTRTYTLNITRVFERLHVLPDVSSLIQGIIGGHLPIEGKERSSDRICGVWRLSIQTAMLEPLVVLMRDSYSRI